MSIITAEVVDGVLEVTGIVVGRSDGAAVCTLTATAEDGTVRESEAQVTPSGGDSYCPLLTADVSDVPAGLWDVRLGYRSESGVTGASPSIEVQVS